MLIWVNAIYLIWFPHSLESSTASLSLLGPGGVSVDRYVLFLYILLYQWHHNMFKSALLGGSSSLPTMTSNWEHEVTTARFFYLSYFFDLSLSRQPLFSPTSSPQTSSPTPLSPFTFKFCHLPFQYFLPHQSLTFSSWHSTHSLRPSIRPLVDCPTRWSLWYGYLDFYFDTQMTWEI